MTASSRSPRAVRAALAPVVALAALLGSGLPAPRRAEAAGTQFVKRFAAGGSDTSARADAIDVYSAGIFGGTVDFGGDGKADPAIFCPSNGLWFGPKRDQSAVVLNLAGFGRVGDQPF